MCELIVAFEHNQILSEESMDYTDQNTTDFFSTLRRTSKLAREIIPERDMHYHNRDQRNFLARGVAGIDVIDKDDLYRFPNAQKLVIGVYSSGAIYAPYLKVMEILSLESRIHSDSVPEKLFIANCCTDYVAALKDVFIGSVGEEVESLVVDCPGEVYLSLTNYEENRPVFRVNAEKVTATFDCIIEHLAPEKLKVLSTADQENLDQIHRYPFLEELSLDLSYCEEYLDFDEMGVEIIHPHLENLSLSGSKDDLSVTVHGCPRLREISLSDSMNLSLDGLILEHVFVGTEEFRLVPTLNLYNVSIERLSLYLPQEGMGEGFIENMMPYGGDSRIGTIEIFLEKDDFSLKESIVSVLENIDGVSVDHITFC